MSDLMCPSTPLPLLHFFALSLLRLRSMRPIACPNHGFMSKLIELDIKLHGKPSLLPGDEALGHKRGKPEPRVCGVCGAKVGVSTASLRVHYKSKHPEVKLPDKLEPSDHAVNPF
jgi:hypothetical protein